MYEYVAALSPEGQKYFADVVSPASRTSEPFEHAGAAPIPCAADSVCLRLHGMPTRHSVLHGRTLIANLLNLVTKKLGLIARRLVRLVITYISVDQDEIK